jgi:Cof subfamily protein (haloacid dehalogenase superfamily)
VTDLDGTLLDEGGEIPPGTLRLIDELERRGIVFCPASGRQYANIVERFGPRGQGLLVIAENGTQVVQDGREISSNALDVRSAREVLVVVRDLITQGAEVGAVLCGKRSAYIEHLRPDFVEQVNRHYSVLTEVDDLTAVEDEPLKIAVYAATRAEEAVAPALARFTDDLQVVVSGQHWVDVMSLSASKGAAVLEIQRRHGIGSSQTVVFGDYLNDLQMIAAADYSFAVSNAHPDVLAAARFVAPANTDNGVLRAISSLLRLDAAPGLGDEE